MTEKLVSSILSASVGGGKLDTATPPSREELGEAFTLLSKHDLSHLVGYALKRSDIKVDEDVASVLNKSTDTAAVRYMKISRDIRSISTALEEGGVPFILLKGSVLRQYYREPWLRTSCDIDLLIRECDIERARAIFVDELDFTYLFAWSYDVSFETPSGTHIELHHTLCDDDTEVDAVLSSVWDNATLAEGTSFTYGMTYAMYYFYHIAHMAKHFISGGCGIRPFVDLWVMRKMPTADVEARRELLASGGLLKFAEAAEALASVWMDGEAHTPLTEQLEQFVFSGGTYGTMENRVAVNQAARGGRLSYIFSRVFLPYDKLRLSYPNLEGKKWLTPVYQVKRWFRLLGKGKFRNKVEEVKAAVAVSEEEDSRTRDLLGELGLK